MHSVVLLYIASHYMTLLCLTLHCIALLCFALFDLFYPFLFYADGEGGGAENAASAAMEIGLGAGIESNRMEKRVKEENRERKGR